MARGQELVPSGPARALDAGTGEIHEVPVVPHLPDEVPLTLRDNTWNGVVPITAQQEQALRAEPNPEKEVDILPSGEVYMSHVFVRRRLNDAFMQHGGWKLRPMSKISIDPETNVMYREYALVINGIAVAAAYGSTKYQPTNKRMDFADAAEATRSNALTRLAKDLGVGSECWDRDWCETWKDKYAVHVWVKVKAWDGRAQAMKEKTENHWRKITRKPFYGEFGILDDSPNYDAWCEQFEAHSMMIEARKNKTDAPKKETPKAAAPKPAAPKVVNAEVVEPQEGAESSRARSSKDETGAAKPLQIKDGERGFYIREVRASREQKKPHQIVMMDGFTYFTYHATTLKAMNEIWAKRQRVKIESETRHAGNRAYPHITEWRVK